MNISIKSDDLFTTISTTLGICLNSYFVKKASLLTWDVSKHGLLSLKVLKTENKSIKHEYTKFRFLRKRTSKHDSVLAGIDHMIQIEFTADSKIAREKL